MTSKEKKSYGGVGRRKRAVAYVKIQPGKGKVDVNGRLLEEYFVSPFQRGSIFSPIEKLSLDGQYDFLIRVKGGGVEAQAIAARLGLARALLQEDENRRQELKNSGYLTRDSRKRERKKYGLKGARKSFQFSKR